MDDPFQVPVSPTSTVILKFITASRYEALMRQQGNLSGNGTRLDGVTEGALFMMILKGIFMGLAMFMALFGNALVIFSVIRIRRLRTVTNYFVVSLAMADLLVAALVMPFNAIQEILQRWIFPEWVCYFFNSNDVLFCTASVLNLCMVAVDRYVAIVKPLRYHQVMTKRAAAFMIVSAWTASLGISYVPIHLNWHLPNFEAVPNPEHCDFKPSAVYSLVSSAISFWLPTFVILFVYGRIYHIALNQAKEMRVLERHMATVNAATAHQSLPVCSSSLSAGGGIGSKHSSLSSAVGHSALNNNNSNSFYRKQSNDHNNSRLGTLVELSPSSRSNSMVLGHNPSLPPSSGSVSSNYAVSTHNHTRAASRSSESRATKVLAIVIGCYLLCWMPFFVWLNVMAICKHCPDSGILGTILFWIGYSNSTFNPVIYAFFSREFRSAFIASLRIDKWSRSLCFKLAKNKSQQSPAEKVPSPIPRSAAPKLYSAHNFNKERQTTSPLQQQIRRRQMQSPRKLCSEAIDDGRQCEVKQPLVAAPSLVVSADDGTEVVIMHPETSSHPSTGSNGIGNNNVENHDEAIACHEDNIEDENDTYPSPPISPVVTELRRSSPNKGVKRAQSIPVAPRDHLAAMLACSPAQACHANNGDMHMSNSCSNNFISNNNGINTKKMVKSMYEVSVVLLDDHSKKLIDEENASPL